MTTVHAEVDMSARQPAGRQWDGAMARAESGVVRVGEPTSISYPLRVSRLSGLRAMGEPVAG